MPAVRLAEHFAELTAPRRREGFYPLLNVVLIGVCAVICGADDFVAMAGWGRTKRDWLAKFLDLSAGIPSHDRFNVILAALKPAQFEQCLLSWITALHEVTGGQIVAIDGKTLRRAASRRFTWSACEPRRTTSTWGRWSRMPSRTRSRRFRNCWNGPRFPGLW